MGAAGIAALLLAPRVAKPMGRGLRALAKGAIKGYLIVSHRARVAVDEAADEWQSLYDQARNEAGREAPGRNGRLAENGVGGVTERRGAAAAEVVNLNDADKETLMLLPGVGERTAEKILQYRKAHGRIGSLQELQDADILFESTAENLRDRVGF
jgi:DNA uptake protein ComE-like DNA-binding protein